MIINHFNLVSMSLALSLATAPHDGIDVNVSIKSCCWQHCRVPGAPLDVEAPLTADGQLVQHLNITEDELMT